MQNQQPKLNTQNTCQKHSEPIVALDLTESDIHQQGLCTACMANCLMNLKRKVVLVQDANTEIAQIKQDARQNQQQQNSKSLEILKGLVQQVVEFKKQYVQSCDKLVENIQHWINLMEEESKNLQQSLESIDTIYVAQLIVKLSEIDVKRIEAHQNFQKLIKDQLQQLSQLNDLQKFNDIVSNINLVSQQLPIVEPEEKVKKPKPSRTPRLNFNCDEHNKEIIMLDIKEQRAKENRVGCIYCIQEQPIKFTALTTVQEKWQVYQKDKNSKLSAYNSHYSTRADNFKLYFSSLKSALIKKIDETTNFLIKNESKLSVQIAVQLSSMHSDWETFSKEEVISIAEILSKQKTYEIESDFKQQEEAITTLVNDSLMKIRETELSCIEKVGECIKLYDSIPIGEFMKPQNLQQEASVQTDISILNHKDLIEQACELLQGVIDFESTSQEAQQSNKEQEVEKLNGKIIDNIILTLNKTEQQCVEEACEKTKEQERKKSNRQCPNVVVYDESDRKDKVLKLSGQINYLPVEGIRVQQKEDCYAIAFNKESTVMVAGCGSKIKVFDFKLGQLKQIQLLSEHTQDVTVLCFMKKSNEFLSGSEDNSILVWGTNNSQQWYCKQQLLKDGHTGRLTCVVINRMENLIISGSDDESMKFWVKKDEWECSQTLTEYTNEVLGISLNESQNQLASCARNDNRILISQFNGDNKWKVVQQISVTCWGRRLCFVGDNLITFQPYNGEKMEILELHKETKPFVKSKVVEVDEYSDGCQYYFPQAYNNQKQILLTKYGETVYVMKRQNDVDFIIDYKQHFGTNDVFGAMTDDTEYLVTWDHKSESFQVVKQQQ